MTEHPRVSVPLAATERSAQLATGRLFVSTAVRRDHAERAWAITTPHLHQSTTLADWKAGAIPLPPYPVGVARWKLAYSFAREVGYDVLVLPSDATVRPALFRLTMTRDRQGSATSWRVDSWSPLGAPGGIAAEASGDAYIPSPRASARSSGIWIVVPFAVLGLALLVPVVLALGRSLRRRRRHAL